MADYEFIVEMKHITKRFPGIVANDDVTVQIRKGEIYALLGENGAGKSTLMSMLFGMYEPDEGEIFIRGEKVKLESPNHATRLNIGMVHQHFKLVSNYTIAENIVMGMEPVKKVLGFLPTVDIGKANSEIRALSEKYGLAVNPEDIIGNVNVSTQQRVEILKMLYREAEILIFDEPTAVLTPQEIDSLLEIIRELREDGKTIILITHKLEEIKRIADRCAILNRGKLIDVLDVAGTSTRTMANLMVGREVSFVTQKAPADFGETVLEVKGLNGKGCVLPGAGRGDSGHRRGGGQRTGGDCGCHSRPGSRPFRNHHPERAGYHADVYQTAHLAGDFLYSRGQAELRACHGFYPDGKSGPEGLF